MRTTLAAGFLMCLLPAPAADGVYRETFNGRLGDGWSWRREHRDAWRVESGALRIRVEPGNMWGPANDAKNILVRNAPDPALYNVDVSVTVSNKPTSQYEQVNLVWYYDDSHMVKLGQELVDGKLCIVMGREQNDRTRTMAIIPIDLLRVDLRFEVRGNQITGHFRAPADSTWRYAGKCDLPINGPPRITLQCYQGPTDAEHWATINDFILQSAPR